jgi:O-methyltransferase
MMPSRGNGLKAIVFGAGNTGKNLTEYLENEKYPIEILAYSDNNSELHNTLLCGKLIIHPDKIKSYDFNIIIVATVAKDNIIKQLVDDYGISLSLIDTKMHARMTFFEARINALRNACKLIYSEGIQGNVAELGVFQGEFAQYINLSFFDRKMYLFDTFEGFSDRDIKKEKELGTKHVLGKFYDLSDTNVDIVLNKMRYPEQCIVKKGYFPDTAIGLEDNFAFVSLDPDLYQPMLEGLRYFYPRLTPGGFLFVHDFFNDAYTGIGHAVVEFIKENRNILPVPLGDNCSVAIRKI